jgi:hypothetical protein
MTVDKATDASNSGMAVRLNRKKRKLLARRIEDSIGGIRIVSSYTDPTVVRKLSWNELNSDDWSPVDPRALEVLKRIEQEDGGVCLCGDFVPCPHEYCKNCETCSACEDADEAAHRAMHTPSVSSDLLRRRS